MNILASILFAVVTHVFTNHNAITGSTQVMINMQEWSSSSVVNSESVTNIVSEFVSTNIEMKVVNGLLTITNTTSGTTVWTESPAGYPLLESATTSITPTDRSVTFISLFAGTNSLTIQPPTPPSGYMVTSRTYQVTNDNTSIVAIYQYSPLPKVYRKFSKLKIYGSIIALSESSSNNDNNNNNNNNVNGTNTWNMVRSWLESKTINGVNGWVAFQLAQEISEDHPLFITWSNELRILLGLTKEQFQELLNACILEG